MTLWDLICHTAKHLTGQRVIVRNRPPVYSGYDATVTKTAEGVPVVDLAPTIQDADFIDIFLHELAHVKIHMNKITPTDVHRTVGSVTAKLSSRGKRAYDQRESEADRLASQWSTYASQHYKKYDGHSTIEQKLWALANMRTT